MVETDIEVVASIDAASQELVRLVSPVESVVVGVDAAQQLRLAAQALDRAREALARAEETVERARAEGLAQGLSEAQSKLTLSATSRRAALRASQSDVITLALELARRIVGHSLELRPALLADLFANALTTVATSARVTLLVNPEDLPMVAESAARLDRGAGTEIEIAADGRVARGACRIETERGVVEASVESQLEALERGLREAATDG